VWGSLLFGIEGELHESASKTDRVLEGRQNYVAEKLSHMSSTDGKGPSHRDCPVPVRQVHLEGLGISAKALVDEPSGHTGQESSSASKKRSSDNLLHGVWRGGIQRFGG
jgi:hypothetical protein